MGLIDLFRPKWKHSNPDVRLAAVEELDTDSNALSEVASRDADPRLRTAALRRIEDPQLLSRLGTEERDEAVKRFVQAEVRRRWLALALDAETVGAARNARLMRSTRLGWSSARATPRARRSPRRRWARSKTTRRWPKSRDRPKTSTSRAPPPSGSATRRSSAQSCSPTPKRPRVSSVWRAFRTAGSSTSS